MVASVVVSVVAASVVLLFIPLDVNFSSSIAHRPMSD